ncbi:hypothetical protein HZC34_03230 [Candidatus Saganbacteria bacterium]|nr:hypothetical protein [Candidatus Saganbacteria bacterium]
MNHNNHNFKTKCTVCSHEFELPSNIEDGERVTCPNCFAQLMIKIESGKKLLRCALCGDPNIAECPGDCEKRIIEREKRGFFDVRL